MRSLSIKLTLAFLFVGLIGALLSAYFIQRRTRTEFDRFLFDSGKDRLVENLANYYKQKGSWQGVNRALIRMSISRDNLPIEQPTIPEANTMVPLRNLPPLLLTDANGMILFGNPGREGSVRIRNLEKLPIEVDGEIVGWLIANRDPTPWQAQTPEGAFLGNINRAIQISALISVVIALILGAVLAQTLTRPLRELTEATQIIAQGELGYQVEVHSNDELGDLSSSFNKMSADLEKSTLARRQMTADVAHDLRTPLSVILGYTEALMDGKLDGSKDIYKVLHDEAGHLQRLIDDLQTLSMVDAGELPLLLQDVSPEDLLKRTAAAMREHANAADITIIVNSEDNLPKIHVDPERIAQVLGNLVNNAIRYTPQGGKIELIATSKNGSVFLRVRDNGVGITPEDLPYVFDRFYRGSKSRQQNGEAGLGLAIAKSLVEAHNGQISVVSNLGEGTAFTIEIPIRTGQTI